MNKVEIDPILPMDPRCVAAGMTATTIYIHLLLLDGLRATKGVLPLAYVNPAYLSKYLGSDEETIEESLKALKDEGLIQYDSAQVRLLTIVKPKEGARKSASGVKRPRPSTTTVPEEAHLVAQVLADFVCKHHQNSVLAKSQPAVKTERISKWANTIRLMNTHDKHSYAQIQAMIEAAYTDQFWFKVIVSPNSLRKNWDKIMAKRSPMLLDPSVGRVEPLTNDDYADGELSL